ncbi:MAG TPA: FkbM family methyltransferase [Sphingomicrobium sp.]
MPDLIYDIGMHTGEDSEFYLRKGFRVVAVEADPELCKASADRLHDFVAAGELTIVNRAITRRRGATTFYRTSVSGWGTVVPEWKADMEARGVTIDSIVVEGITLAELVDEYGDAFYAKLDIEGMDRRALESLRHTSVRPRYVSMETSYSRHPNLAAIEADFETLQQLGYDRFKIVDQTSVPFQVPPSPALVGREVAVEFVEGASGLFGEETPGEWNSAEKALAAFRRMSTIRWLHTRLYRRPRIYRYFCSIMSRLSAERPNLDWYDIHAKHSSVE